MKTHFFNCLQSLFVSLCDPSCVFRNRPTFRKQRELVRILSNNAYTRGACFLIFSEYPLMAFWRYKIVCSFYTFWADVVKSEEYPLMDRNIDTSLFARTTSLDRCLVAFLHRRHYYRCYAPIVNFRHGYTH